jgi:hypothetical protein
VWHRFRCRGGRVHHISRTRWNMGSRNDQSPAIETCR